MISFYFYFADNAGVIVNPKGEMKGECLLFRYIFYYTLLEVPACIKKTKNFSHKGITLVFYFKHSLFGIYKGTGLELGLICREKGNHGLCNFLGLRM